MYKNDSRIFTTSSPEIKSKWIKDLRMRLIIIKLLRENTNSADIGVINNFLDIKLAAPPRKVKENTNKKIR